MRNITAKAKAKSTASLVADVRNTANTVDQAICDLEWALDVLDDNSVPENIREIALTLRDAAEAVHDCFDSGDFLNQADAMAAGTDSSRTPDRAAVLAEAHYKKLASVLHTLGTGWGPAPLKTHLAVCELRDSLAQEIRRLDGGK